MKNSSDLLEKKVDIAPVLRQSTDFSAMFETFVNFPGHVREIRDIREFPFK